MFSKSLLVKGTAWTLGGYFFGQVIRFVGNILLARLITPDIFGFMSLVYTLIQGVEMFSDLGLGLSIIRDKQGDDPKFLRTAWTIQIIRGLIITAATALIAYPMSLLYSNSQLLFVLPVVGLNSLIASFNTPILFTYNRHLKLALPVLFDLGTQIFSLAIVLITAYYYPSVWALVFGTFCYYVVRVFLSYKLFPGFTPKLEIDPEVKKGLLDYGKGIFLSSIIGYFSNQLDILTIGFLFSFKTLGLYSIALALAKAPFEVCRLLINKIGFPWLSKAHREEVLSYNHLYKLRIKLLLPFILVQIAFYFLSVPVIHLLYKPDYWDAGWMLKWLSIGFIAAIINQTYSLVWFVTGETMKQAYLLIAHIVLFITLLTIGYHLGHEKGVIIAISMLEIFFYPIQSYFIAKRGLWQPLLDFAGFAVIFTLIYLNLHGFALPST